MEALTLRPRVKTGARKGLFLSTTVEFKNHWSFTQVSVAFQYAGIRHKYLYLDYVPMFVIYTNIAIDSQM